MASPRVGYGRAPVAPGSVTPARTTIAPGVYQGKQQILADALMQSRNAAQQGPQDIGAQVGQALNTIGTSYMAGANERAGQAERTAANDTAKAALAAALRGEPLDAGAIDAIGSEWVDPGYQQVIGTLLAQQMKPGDTDLVQAVGPDGQLTWVPKSQAAGMQSALPEGPKAAPTRQIGDGRGNLVDQEMAPDGTWHEIGRRPQFAPQQPREPRQRSITTLYGPNGQAKSLYDDDPSIPGLLQEGWIDDKPASNTMMVQTGVDANGNPIFEMQATSGTKPLTEGQSTGTMQFSLAEQANNTLGEADQVLTSPGDYIASQFGTPGNYFKSPEYQNAEQAATVMAEQYLRALTGAAAPDAEVARTARSIMPQPGDGPDVIAQKRATRETIIQALRVKAGPGADRVGPVAPPAAGQEPVNAPQTGQPNPGDIQDGYRFKGGNPADPNSWEPVS